MTAPSAAEHPSLRRPTDPPLRVDRNSRLRGADASSRSFPFRWDARFLGATLGLALVLGAVLAVPGAVSAAPNELATLTDHSKVPMGTTPSGSQVRALDDGGNDSGGDGGGGGGGNGSGGSSGSNQSQNSSGNASGGSGSTGTNSGGTGSNATGSNATGTNSTGSDASGGGLNETGDNASSNNSAISGGGGSDPPALSSAHAGSTANWLSAPLAPIAIGSSVGLLLFAAGTLQRRAARSPKVER